jgi:conjugative relaxase-like TrwC/TraI family protein
MLTIRAMSDGKGYSSRHLEHGDYYAEGERVFGRWQGRGAELLGLAGEIKSEDFEALRQGLDPRTDEFLRQRKSADRVMPDGTVQSHGRNLYDFTISAPKSVSVMATLGGDKRLIDAHEKAVTEALKEIEFHAGARVRLNKANDNRITGNMVIALYHHDASRELDPQLHTHAVAANLTYDSAEGRWKALQASGIYERRAYLTEVYRNALAREVRSLGYEIETGRGSRRKDQGFEIRGIPDDLLTKCSQRSRQRDQAIKQFVARTGRQPTDNEVAILVRDTRADKLIEISIAEVTRRQRSRLTLEETLLLSRLRPREGVSQLALNSGEASLEYAKDHVFERVSVAKDYEILAEALRHGRGQVDHQQLKNRLAFQESLGMVLRNGNETATTASLQREKEMINCINRGIGDCERLDKNNRYIPSNKLNLEQNEVIRFVLDSRDRTVNIRGAAGTGKTATLRELQRAILESGHEVMAIAPTMSAVEELQKVGFRDAVTIERLLQDLRRQLAIRCKVLIVDEAGMVSGRQMRDLLKLMEKHSARIVFSGDTRQIQSVEACDALRVLENESRLKSVELVQVQRQTAKEYREAIKELRRDPTKGFEKLDAMGAVREVPWLDRAEAVARAFADAEAKGRNALVVCATHEEIDRVTETIRTNRKKRGQIGNGVEVGRDVSLNWTTAQKSDARNYRPGQMLAFHRAIRGIAKNDALEVIRIDGNRIIASLPFGGLKKAITSKDAKSFDVCERRNFEIAQGDKLLITANRRGNGFRCTNGEIVTVDSIDHERRIVLTDGRILPLDFRQFTHGYAVTAHRSQGKSVDEVIISGDGMRKELFYVAASRGKESLQIITSDKELLRESAGLSNARQSASELERANRPGLHQGMNRGLVLARSLARQAAQFISHLGKPLALTRELPHQPIVENSHDWGIE